MRQIKVDYRHPQPAPRPAPHPRPAPPQGRPPAQGGAPEPPGKTRRCNHHPGVHMVLAGYNTEWNTVRYLCPMCHAMGLPPVEVATGVINAYFPDKGYGFIENGGPRIFFHLSDLATRFTPQLGMPVTCRVEANDKGLIGREVMPR